MIFRKINTEGTERPEESEQEGNSVLRVVDVKEHCNKFQYMRATLTVSLPDEMSRELAALVKRSGKSRSQVVQDALRRQIALERFRDLREQLVRKGAKAGFHTDEDVFRAIS